MESANENQELKILKICKLDYISRLPVSVVHHIYSFLPPRDVASTSILSRTWNRYWYTYPYAVFNFIYSSYYSREENELLLGMQKLNFVDIIEKAVLRRFGQELYMQRFQMFIDFFDLPFLAPYLTQWISMAIGKGVPELALRVEVGRGEFRRRYSVPQIVLRAESLKVLSLGSCTFRSGLDVRLPCLKKFSLCRCQFEDEFSFHIIMSGCPMIEYVKISYCRWTGKVLSVMNLPLLKHFEFLRCKDIDSVEIHSTNLHTFSFAPAPSQHPKSFNLKSCKALKELKLSGLGQFSNFLPEHLISQLPALVDLEFQCCTGSADFRISSQMLKRLAFRNCHDLKLAKVETPNLQSFEYCHCDEPFIPINASTDLKVHLIFELQRQTVDRLIRLSSFLSMWSSMVDLKLVVYHQSKNMIIHERWSDISLWSLCNFMYPKSICISSKSFNELMDEFIPIVYPGNVYVIYSQEKTVEVLSEKIKNVSRNPNLKHQLAGLEVNTCEAVEDQMDPVTAVFIGKYNIPPYNGSVLTLNWMRDMSG